MNTPQVLSLSDAVGLIRSGDRLVLGHGAVSPVCLLEELVRQCERLDDVTIFQLIYLGTPVHLSPACEGHLRVVSPFLFGQEMRRAVAEHRADYLPIHFSYVPRLFEQGGAYANPDWALIQVSLPDERGYYSCSLSSDFTLPAARAAKGVIAVVNPELPYIGGDNLLHQSEITAVVLHESAPPEVPQAQMGEVDERIAELCADLIEDHSTIQVGIGAIPDAVLGKLTSHKDLGVHTELFSDSVMELHKTGVITGRYKGLHEGKIIGSFVMGSRELYRYLDHNADFELYPVDYANNPYVIGKNYRFVSINSCVEVDLYAQVCAEKVGGRMFSGSGGQLDYVRGVRYSEGGKSILAMRSTAKDGTLSRIRANLHPQACVTTPRNDVDYIVTEYGVAHLFGVCERVRARRLIAVAHPDFREDLEREAHARFGVGKVF